MSTRRVPLSSNPNAANSPLRASSAALHASKKVRSHADTLRAEPYGQPPPAKRQMIERSVASPSRPKTTRTVVYRSASRATVGSASTTHKPAEYKPTKEELLTLRTWHTQIRARFPKMVFYFESISDDQRSKLAKQVGQLGAREEKFFSIAITHVVTTRPIPPEKPAQDGNEAGADSRTTGQEPKTIDPSLLNRTTDSTMSATTTARPRLVIDATSSRKASLQIREDPIRRPKARSTDVLDRAREMGKKIWSLEKLHKILDNALHPDPYVSAALGLSRGTTQSASKPNDEPNLRQLLDNERVHGPSDRDPTVSDKDLYLFKGPYIYVYDMAEKTKPIMAREYPRVSESRDGDWPQFHVVSQGRCPFIADENHDLIEKARRERSRAKERDAKAAVEDAAEDATENPAPKLKASQVPPLKPVTGKRTLSQMEDGHNRRAASARATESFDKSRVSNPPQLQFLTQNACMSHAKPGRFLVGEEPLASGVQPSNVTSAIRSQMISSTAGGVLGARAGTSKEIHGLQRKVVLQKASVPALSHDTSSRRAAERSHHSNAFARSASVSIATHPKLDTVDQDETFRRQREKLRRTASVPVPQPKPKRDPKPGYCENCQDKFADFEEHILSRTHREFAENDENWAQLDALLSQLQRIPRR